MQPLLHLDATAAEPLVVQIVQGLTQGIMSRRLRPGSRAPSIREFARTHGVSTSTVVEAYDRLVGTGLLTARRGAGFFVVDSARGEVRPPPDKDRLVLDGDWLLRNVYEHSEVGIHAGCGWLPEPWHDVEAVSRGLRQLAQHPRGLIGYGAPQGPRASAAAADPTARGAGDRGARLPRSSSPMGPARAWTWWPGAWPSPGTRSSWTIPATATCCPPCACVGLHLVGVPMTPTGPDVAGPGTAARPSTSRRLYFTNTQLHNPTGASYSAASAFQVLRLAERHQFLVVEDNVSADLVPGPRHHPGWSADQLRRVIYVGSFSKAIAPGLRVGFVVAEPGLLEELVYFKLVSGMSTPGINERLVHAIFMEGHVRKHLEHLRDRLAKAQERTCRRLEHAGFARFFEPGAGMFVWAKPQEEHQGRAGALAARPGAGASCWRRGTCSGPDSSPAPGCASTWPTATTTACSASWRRDGRQPDVR